MVNFTTLLETELVGPPNAEKSHTRSQSHFTQCCKHGWVIPPPTVSARNWTKYNKSLKDPVRGAGSAQVQIRSYHNRQSGNLARKVRNAFPGLTALRWFSTEYAVRLSNFICVACFISFPGVGWAHPPQYFEYALITHLDTSTRFWIL